MQIYGKFITFRGKCVSILFLADVNVFEVNER